MKHSRQDIIQTGQDIFRSKGYHATGISEILEASSVPKGTFYNYFSSKEDFASACLLSYSQQVKKLIKTYMDYNSLSPDKRLRRYFDQLVKLNKKEGADSGCLLMNFASEIGGQVDTISEIAKREFSEWIILLEPTIEEAQRQKLIHDDYSPNQLARLIYYTVFGSFTEMKNLRSTKRMEQQLSTVFRLLKVKQKA